MFLGDTKAEALLHGHSYTAHPVGCVISIHALETYNEMFRLHNQGEYEDEVEIDGTMKYFSQDDVSSLLELLLVQESMALGTVLAVTIEPDSSGSSGYATASRSIPIVKYLFEKGVYVRPLGNVVYIMVSPLTSRDECLRLSHILRDAIKSVSAN